LTARTETTSNDKRQTKRAPGWRPLFIWLNFSVYCRCAFPAPLRSPPQQTNVGFPPHQAKNCLMGTPGFAGGLGPAAVWNCSDVPLTQALSLIALCATRERTWANLFRAYGAGFSRTLDLRSSRLHFRETTRRNTKKVEPSSLPVAFSRDDTKDIESDYRSVGFKSVSLLMPNAARQQRWTTHKSFRSAAAAFFLWTPPRNSTTKDTKDHQAQVAVEWMTQSGRTRWDIKCEQGGNHAS
jgi:hypothetical protein